MYELDHWLGGRCQTRRDWGLVMPLGMGYFESLERANIRLFWVAMLVIPYGREVCDRGCFEVSIATGAFVERAFNVLGSHSFITLSPPGQSTS